MHKKKIALPSILSILILLAGGAGYYLMNQYFSQYQVTAASTIVQAKAVKASGTQDQTLKQIIQENQKRVVQVMVQKDSATVLGSGFLYNQKGDVITNAHVVKGAKTVTVKTADAKTFTGHVIGIGHTVDVAVVRVPGLAGKSPMKIADHKAEIGDKVIALGSPLGLQNTVTTGIISGINRDFSIGSFNYKNVYQISAPITHGNSGGPLLSQETGAVLAINSAGTKEGNIGFSIPITEVLSKVESWSKNPETIKGINGKITDGSSALGQVSEQDAKNLVNDFYNSLNAGDYVTAYALLGSGWQKEVSYQKFRNGYIHTMSSNIKKITTAPSSKNNTVTVTIILEADEHIHGHDRTSQYKEIYTVGYENGQLKLLDGSGNKLS